MVLLTPFGFLKQYSHDGEERSYEELQQIEKQRRELVQNGRTMSRFKILASFTGTIMPHLVRSRQSWGTLLLYILLRVLLGLEIIKLGEDVPVINTSLLSVLGGFMSFFLVFFLSQAYGRFMAQYEISKNMEGRIIHIAYLAKVSLPPEDAWRLIRYINTAHILGYVGLSETYNETNLFNPFQEHYKLLTFSELQRVRDIGIDSGSAPYLEVLGWCIDLMYEINYRGKTRPPFSSTQQENHHQIVINLDDSTSLQKIAQHKLRKHAIQTANCVQQLDSNSMLIMMDELLAFRNLMSSLFTFADQTFPFSYIHLTLMISAIYLPLFAYCTATFLPTNGDYYFTHLLGALFVSINIVFVVGVREIGRQMIDPYGEDLQDLMTIQYLENGLNDSRRIMCGYRFASVGLDAEMEMEEGRPQRSKPFRHSPFKYSLSNASSFLVTNHQNCSFQQEETMQQEDAAGNEKDHHFAYENKEETNAKEEDIVIEEFNYQDDLEMRGMDPILPRVETREGRKVL